ncbi:hypothetical protein CAEBREN_01538 [Caenorhabditis brenneri]|uniref:Peptidase S1 domain-containing protein n=1 Tax=Caenorhabditis brenneri TaxID=135651 RepID=G0N983_CAEBE|nr:hypothetical protein CAEBREN_01538 [Caenorhabditis brenneri]
MTAAHCVFSKDEFALTAKVTLNDVYLSKYDDQEQEFRSHAMAISKQFLNGVSEANNDVGIVFLPKIAAVCDSATSAQIAKLTSTPSISFVRSFVLDSVDSEYFQIETPITVSQFQLENSVCYIAGWGKTENKTASYSDNLRQMMVKLSIRRVGKRKYLMAKGVVGSSRACMGDSGSPVYCFIEGKRVLVGTIAHIGSFVKMSQQDPSDHLHFCRDFEYTFIADWRESSERVVEILEKYGELYQLNEGQNICFGPGKF